MVILRSSGIAPLTPANLAQFELEQGFNNERNSETLSQSSASSDNRLYQAFVSAIRKGAPSLASMTPSERSYRQEEMSDTSSITSNWPQGSDWLQAEQAEAAAAQSDRKISKYILGALAVLTALSIYNYFTVDSQAQADLCTGRSFNSVLNKLPNEVVDGCLTKKYDGAEGVSNAFREIFAQVGKSWNGKK